MSKKRRGGKVSISSSRVLICCMMGVIGGSVSFFAQAKANEVNCDNLVKQAFPGMEILSAEIVKKGQFKIPDGPGPMALLEKITGINAAGQTTLATNPDFCRVSVLQRPTADSEIKMEVWLPLRNWNGKFMGTGNFSWGGYFMYPVMLSGLEKGYATASTDNGHDEGNPAQKGGRFILGHPEKFTDYAWRAHHLMARDAKTIIKAFFGQAPERSYWIGCSLGGIEGLIEAKNFPEDYDGMVVGAPPNPLLNFNAAQLWPMWLVNKHPEMNLTRQQLERVHQAVLKQCASPVGQKQGFVEEPDKCGFEPKQLMCKPGEKGDCLTAPQVSLMEAIYRGPTDPQTGERIFQGPAKGSELEIDDYLRQPHQTALDLFRYAVYQNPQWDWKNFDWHKDIVNAKNVLNGRLGVDTNLKPFFKRGGKILMFIGWNDFHNPQDAVAYYNGLIEHSGKQVNDYLRLFINPGMAHCHSGDGCDTFNKIDALNDWFEHDKAPVQITALRVVEGKVVRSRPLCAYPQKSRYLGKGDINLASSFSCVK
ncbi:tannase/feruloyl esterase family alpha/beta hydrolase [Pantoea cypripedii]|uniref:Tannase/feruloyl esterase family alpha/beta hydrolase n=1 Tax=Pantoea cypripedii TaxID=55209 RepID=A0A6B9G518_PANCY|nr:tannase/feruloyl esterase family alpha/beta hydrolase [Pantoea cypripedii]QGY32781.1 tannase/feruloyl esterase family alpha/beta hydrolase [Pantoea cypripedii]